MKTGVAALLMLVFSFAVSSTEFEDASAEQNPIKIVGLQVPWLLDFDKPGPYNQIADELLLNQPQQISFEILPLMRAMRHFFEGDADCFFVGDVDEAYFKQSPLANVPILVSEPFNTVAMRIFSFDREKPYSSIDQISDQRVAVDLGVGGIIRIRKVIPELAQAFDALNADQVHFMLTRRRAEAALMMDYDYALFAARNPTKPKLQYDPAVAIEPANDAIMCKKNKRTEALIAHVNARIEEMNRSGELQALLHTAPTSDQQPQMAQE